MRHPYPGYYYPSLVAEYVFVFQKPAATKKHFNIYWNRSPAEKAANEIDMSDYQGEKSKNVWKIRQLAPQQNLHPCPFPLELAERVIELYSNKGDSVIDIFAGSGQTNCAAEKLGRKHLGIETQQRFNTEHIVNEIAQLLSYQSDALHWNLSRVDDIAGIGQMALDAYTAISHKLDVEMTSWESAHHRITNLRQNKEHFMQYSRKLAKQAQTRESLTIQPKELLTGIKATLTIQNFLGGCYYWTCDEVEIHGNQMHLIEGKHSRKAKLPSDGDTKDALLKMMLFANLENLRVGAKQYIPIPIVKLTTAPGLSLKSQSAKMKSKLRKLWHESHINGFRVSINGEYLTLHSM